MVTHSRRKHWARIAIVIALLAVSLLAPPSVKLAHAQTITVTTTAEAPGGAGDCTLGEAIQAANTLSAVDACPSGSGDDLIILASGATYTLTIAAAGDQSAFLISRQVTLQGNHATLVHDLLGAPLRFFTMTASSRLTLIDLTLTGGLVQGADGVDGASNGASGTPGQAASGGAINSRGGQITLDGVRFISNRAIGGRGGNGFAGASAASGAVGGRAVGGAITASGLVTIHTGGAYFSGNQALGGRGGNGGLLPWPGGAGADALAGALATSHLDTTGGPLTMEDNLALGGNGGSGTPSGWGGQGQGGGVFMSDGNVRGALLTGNLAQGGSAGSTLSFDANVRGGAATGGAIFAVDVQLFASRLVSNTAQGGAGLSGGGAQGGGLYYADVIPANFQADVIVTNTAVGGQATDPDGAGGEAFGGGVYVWSALVSMTESAVVGNTAQGGADSGASSVALSQGGGLAIYGSGTLTNTTLALNHATQGGGLVYGGASTVNLTHVTVISNSASIGGLYGGLYGNGIVLRNSLVAYNTYVNCSGGVFGTGSNLQFPGSSCASVTLGDPRLLPVGDNGGNTLTAALVPDSPAIDAGNGLDCPTTDQRGYRRPVGAGCDLGAYERWLDLFLPLTRR